MLNVCDIDYLMEVVRTKKVLDVEKIKSEHTPSFAKVFNIDEDRLKYIDLRENPLSVLHQSSSVVPYYSPFYGQTNIDGGVIEQIGFERVRQRHPNGQIIFCINYHPKQFNNLKTSLRNSLEGIVASWIFPNKGMFNRFKNKTNNFNEDINRIMGDKHSLLIHPPLDNRTRQDTVDSKTLKETWEMGIKEAEKILEWAG